MAFHLAVLELHLTSEGPIQMRAQIMIHADFIWRHCKFTIKINKKEISKILETSSIKTL